MSQLLGSPNPTGQSEGISPEGVHTTLKPSVEVGGGGEPVDATPQRAGRKKANRELLWRLIAENMDLSLGRASIPIRKIQSEWWKATSSKISDDTVRRAFDDMPEGYQIAPFIDEGFEKFETDPLILKWVEDMKARRNKPDTIQERLRYLYRFIREVRKKPENIDKPDGADFLKKLEIEGQTDSVLQGFSDAIRNFLMSKGVSLPKGMGEILGLPRPTPKGEYAHVTLTPPQIRKLREYFSSDPLVRLFVDCALQFGSRAEALATIPTDRITVTEDEIPTFKDGRETTELIKVIRLQVFESKVGTKDVFLGEMGTWWKKIIPLDLYDEIMKLKRSEHFIFIEKGETDSETRAKATSFLSSLRGKLKEAYRAIGVAEPYAFDHSVHILRHTFAQTWLRRLDYNYDAVAILGNWEGTQTLRSHYGAPPEYEQVLWVRKANIRELLGLNGHQDGVQSLTDSMKSQNGGGIAPEGNDGIVGEYGEEPESSSHTTPATPEQEAK